MLCWSSPHQTMYVYGGLLPRAFQDAIAHAAEVLSVCEPILSECALFTREKPKLCLLLFFLYPSAPLPSPQEVISVGDEALTLCCAASVKPVFSFNPTELLTFSTSSHTCSSVNLFTPAGAVSCRAVHFSDVNVLAQYCRCRSWLQGFSSNFVTESKYTF